MIKKLLVGAALLGLCAGAWATDDAVVAADAPKAVVTAPVADVKAPVVKKHVSKKKAAKAMKKEVVAAPEAVK